MISTIVAADLAKRLVEHSTVIAGGLAKRLVEDQPQSKAPSVLAVLFALGDVVVFFPVLVILFYTLANVYPTLAAVEDPLPAYDALPLNDDGLPKNSTAPVAPATAQPGKPLTSSLRSINRLLCSYGSWRAQFRGLGYAIVIAILMGSTTLFLNLAPFIPVRIAHLLAMIAVSPLAATWTHFVITPPPTAASPRRSFFRRVPPLRKAYAATWFPTFLLWAAAHASAVLPVLLGRLIGLGGRDLHQPIDAQPPLSGSEVAKALCVFGVAIGLQVVLVIPTETVLARVQASLLPADEEPVVPFDRSFGGRVEPEVVSGKGFATFGAALKTVSFASWVRICLLHLKVTAVTMAVYVAIGVVIALELLILMATGR